MAAIGAVGLWRRQHRRETIPMGGRKAAVSSADGVNVMATPTMTWLKLKRRLACDGNSLRRRSDLIEAWLLPGVIAAFVTLSPLVAAATSAWAGAGNAAARHAEQSWHRVPALLLQAAPGPEMSDHGANTWLAWTRARWVTDGRPRQGLVPAPAKTRAGSTVPVWLDRAGNPQMPPPTAAQAGDRVVVATSIALAGLAALLACAALLTRLVLDRRRLASWDTAWLSAGPNWSRQE